MISRILVPTDGSKAAQKAAKYAVGLAKQLGASIIVLSVIDNRSLISKAVLPSSEAMRLIEPVEDYLSEAAEEYCGDIKEMCEKNNISSKIVVASGHPVDEIAKIADKEKASLIVIGSHGRSALSAAALGSVTYGLIHRGLRVPVLVTKR